MNVAFYFNGVQIGGFSQKHSGAGGPEEQTVSSFVEPVTAGEAYTFGAEGMAQAGLGSNEANAIVEVQAAPEPATIFLAGLVCVAFCLFLKRRPVSIPER
jgi:hypothetical protein